MDVDDEAAKSKDNVTTDESNDDGARSFDNLTTADWEEMYLKEISTVYENENNLDLGHISIIFIASHVIGFLIKYIPPYITAFGSLYAYNTDISMFAGLGSISLLLLFIPYFARRLDYHSAVLLNILCLLELGTTIICISMYNFSLGFIIGVVCVPFASLMQPTFNK